VFDRAAQLDPADADCGLAGEESLLLGDECCELLRRLPSASQLAHAAQLLLQGSLLQVPR